MLIIGRQSNYKPLNQVREHLTQSFNRCLFTYCNIQTVVLQDFFGYWCFALVAVFGMSANRKNPLFWGGRVEWQAHGKDNHHGSKPQWESPLKGGGVSLFFYQPRCPTGAIPVGEIVEMCDIQQQS